MVSPYGDFASAIPETPFPSAPKTGGMFGGGDSGWANALLAAVAGFMSRRNPAMSSGIINNLQQRQLYAQKQQQDEAQYQRERGDKFTDFQKQYDYELAHPKETQPHYFQSNSGDEYALGPDGKPQLAFKDPFPFKFVPNGMGGVVPIDMRSYTGGSGPAPKPLSDGDIIRMSGGQTPPASGAFPGY